MTAPVHRVVLVALRLVTAAGLAIDAYVHADLAGSFAHNGHTLTQGDLFLIEAGAASAAALLVLVLPRWYTVALAVLIAASALGAVLLYRYVDVGTLGPLPNMYEPIWYPEKTASAIAEATALAAGLGALALSLATRRARHGASGPAVHTPAA